VKSITISDGVNSFFITSHHHLFANLCATSLSYVQDKNHVERVFHDFVSHLYNMTFLFGLNLDNCFCTSSGTCVCKFLIEYLFIHLSNHSIVESLIHNFSNHNSREDHVKSGISHKNDHVFLSRGVTLSLLCSLDRFLNTDHISFVRYNAHDFSIFGIF